MTGQSRVRFEYSAKRRQGDFRDSSDTISPEGSNPSDDIGTHHRHLLALGREMDNLYPSIRGADGALRFFKDRDIKWWKSSEKGGDIKGDGPTRNMASSQVACVNFLLPLIEIPGALLAALKGIDGDVRRIVDIEDDKGNKAPVEFEWIGLGRSLEGRRTRGTRTTSIDAFLVAETETGRKRAYLLEWKYVEQYFSSRPESAYKGAGDSGATRRECYGPRYYAESSSFDPDTAPEMDDFLYDPFYQIMRQRLLADRMIADSELDVTEAKVVVVVPEENLAYRELITAPPLKERFPEIRTVAEIMETALKQPGEQFAMVVPAALVDSVDADCGESAAQWAEYWRHRYGV